MGFVFGGPERPLFKVGVVADADRQAGASVPAASATSTSCPSRQEAEALHKITHQQIDLLVDLQAGAALLGEH